MTRKTRWYALGVCALTACTSNEVTSTNGGTDAAIQPIDATVDAPAEASTDAGSTECNELANVGAPVEQVFMAGDPPAAAGGTITSGTYVMTAFVIYTGVDGGAGPTGITLRETFAIQDGASGGTYQRVQSSTDDGSTADTVFRATGEYVHLAGAGVEARETCPERPTPFNAYDSDGAKLRFYAPAAGPQSPAVMVEYAKR